MASNLLSNLHGGKLPDSLQKNTLMQNISERMGDIGSRLSSLQSMLSVIPQAVEHKYFNLKKTVGAGLNRQRKKYRLALESLGWGTLADILDSAFCGKILNILA